MTPYRQTGKETLDALSVDAQRGLTAKQVEQSRAAHGRNAFTREKPPSLLRRVWESAKEPMTILLFVAAFITLGVNFVRLFTGSETDFIECIGIFVAIFLSIFITIVMEGRSAKAFEALNRLGEGAQIKVIRDGKAELISQSELVVGDIVSLETGEKVPADGRLIEAVSLCSDESALTGESEPVEKNADAVLREDDVPVAERVNMLYSGCFITGGHGLMVVTSVGDATEFGKIARELSGAERGSTPIQEKLARLGSFISKVGGAVAAIAFVVQLIQFWVQGSFSLASVSEAFITSIALIVAAVPEGLPTIVAVALALNIIKMSKQNALVKKLVAGETVGCINVICSDKTGTLTENRMTVRAVVGANGEKLEPAEVKEERLLQNFCLNSTADVDFEKGREGYLGNPTECALLTAAHEAGVDYHTARQQMPMVMQYPFSSELKNMTTVATVGEETLAFTKGSPEKILALCEMDEAEHAAQLERIESYQRRAYRVIGFAHRTIDPVEAEPDNREGVERGFHWDGFVAIQDPLRKDVYEAVKKCRSAGVDIKMLTGDNLVTASAIAEELGILDGEHRAVEARYIESLDDAALARELPSIRVIARSTPVVKMRVVKMLKSQGNVVAVTGDGINDAPALKNADVGIAMGITGTEVSKEAADIVLLDDSFSTIVRAISWGRGIYENFQRFIKFQLTVNLSSVITVLGSIFAGFAAPFTALQLLWVNLIMDGPPALTLGLEPMRSGLMKRAPVRRDAGIITGAMLGQIIFGALYIAGIFLLQHFTNFMGATPEQESTVLFTLFVVFQLFNAFNSRELGRESVLKNIGSNKLMLLVFAGTFALQFVITQFGGPIFDTVALPAVMWLKVLGVGITVVLAGELYKLVWRLVKR